MPFPRPGLLAFTDIRIPSPFYSDPQIHSNYLMLLFNYRALSSLKYKLKWKLLWNEQVESRL